ncbi:MAG TPA: hypothetical protein VGV18_12930 [Verrucomicrobiae bacterium]|nr:hypothetical protein [Verrucomicrobiae bacterium]
MNRLIPSLVFLLTASGMDFAQADWVHFDSTGQTLVYSNDNLGNHLIDYSYAGYEGGGVAIPTNIPVQQTVNAARGDNTANIQNAINYVGGLTPDTNGFRGVVLLSPGTYEMDGTLTFNSNNGVILRGSGTNNTTLVFYGTSGTSIALSGGGVNHVSGSTHYITDSYVPLGATNFDVDSTSGWAVGTQISVERPFTPPWISAIGMASLWGTNKITYYTESERSITAINGNQVTVNIPLPTPIESQWTTWNGNNHANAWQYTDGRLQKCGVENMTVASNFGLTNTAPNGGILAISLGNAENCWARNIAFNGYGGAVSCGGKWNTVQDCTFANGPDNGSARPGAFEFYNAQLSLIQRVVGVNGFEHFLQTRDEGSGCVFLYCHTTGTNFDSGPHRLWATSLLTDNEYGTVNNIHDVITTGGGNGWGAGFSVFYNCRSVNHTIQCPSLPNHYNWWIGGLGANSSDLTTNAAVFDHDETEVAPQSLYLEQLKERLGGAAVENIGYTMFSIFASPSSQTVNAGSSNNYTVTLDDPTLMSNVVELSVSGLPPGASASFNPASVTGAGMSALTIVTSTSTPANHYALDVIGTTAGLSHTNAVGFVVVPPSQPRITRVGWSGPTLTFSGTNGRADGTYYVLSTTDLALPRNQWSVIATNIFDSEGDFNFTNLSAPLPTQMFYMLKLP